MKTRVSLFIFCIQMVAVCGFAADKRIDGNGNPETRERLAITTRSRSLAPLISSMNSRIKRLIYP